MAQLAVAVSPTADEMAAARQWVAARLEGAQQPQPPEPFFSFDYGGKPSAELLKTWELKRASRRLDEWRKTMVNYWGDFWPPTTYSLENNVWISRIALKEKPSAAIVTYKKKS